MNATRQLRLPAPAKLNAFLHVTGRRTDGYHSLETLYTLISHGDVVTLAMRSDGAIVRERGAAGLEPEEDLVVRAARLLQAESGTGRGVVISVEKKLPIGAGLGGGSSDAATVLLGLNRLWELGYSRRSLMTLALKLGADVPFFVLGEPALGRGIGELLDPVSLPPTWFVVMNPDVVVTTGTIFTASELTRNTPSTKIALFPEGFGRNDLQAVATARFPAIAACLETLAREAAAARATAQARMTGSGSCVFAAFANEDVAVQVLSRAMRARRLSGFVARALDHHPLRGFAAP